jgi:hypothetical protein
MFWLCRNTHRRAEAAPGAVALLAKASILVPRPFATCIRWERLARRVLTSYESGVGTFGRENSVNFIHLAWQSLPDELQHERLAQIKFFFIRYLDVFLTVVYIIG